jgi:hypothetical protein
MTVNDLIKTLRVAQQLLGNRPLLVQLGARIGVLESLRLTKDSIILSGVKIQGDEE